VAYRMETVEAKLAHFVADAKSSRFTVQAFATGLLSKMGHDPTIGIRNFSAEVSFSPEPAQASDFFLIIQMTSLAVEDDISSKDRREIESLMQTQVLEIAKYPEAKYEAPVVTINKLGDSLYTAALDGKLSFHGVMRSLPVTARIALFGEMLRASGEFTLKQSDYQIKPISVAGGALKLKDELKFWFEMVARKQE
jgi:polyisoprenoid-binding protein YceI